MALFDHNPERLAVVEGGYTSWIHGYDIIYWKGTSNKNIFFAVFHWTLWLGIGVAIGICSVYFFIESMIYQNDESKSMQIIEAIVANAKMMVALDVTEKCHHKKNSMRIILLAFGLLGGVIMWTYSGVLTSFFSIDFEDTPFTSFHDLLAKPALWLMILDGSSLEQVLISAIDNDPALNEVIDQNIIRKDSNDEMMNDFLNTDDRVNFMIFSSLDSLFLYVEKSPDFNFSVMCDIKNGRLDEARGKVKSGWLYPKNSILRPIFDNYMMKISQSGVDNRLRNLFYNFEDHLNCQSDYEEVGMDITLFLFRLLAVGLVISLMVFFIELILTVKWKKPINK